MGARTLPDVGPGAVSLFRCWDPRLSSCRSPRSGLTDVGRTAEANNVGEPRPKERARGPVLVVEDDPATRDALVVLLRHEGYPAECVNDGQEALARLRGGRPPSLVLLDLMLPVMDGFEFRVQQLQDPTLARIPVIVVSGGGDLARKAET